MLLRSEFGGAPACVLVLSTDPEQTTADTRWIFENQEDASTEERTLDGAGRCWVPPGEWIVRPLDDAWRASESVLAARPGGRHVIWADRPHSIVVQVFGIDRRPVSGARIQWRTREGPENSRDELRSWMRPPGPSTVTSSDGRGELSDLAGSTGELVVTADSYQRRVLALTGAQRTLLEVQLVSSAKRDRAVRCREASSGLPVSLVQVWTQYGPLPGVSDSTGVLGIPSWVSDDEYLLFTAPTVCPTIATLYRLQKAGEIRLAARTTLRVNVLYPDGTTYWGKRRFFATVVESPAGADGRTLVPSTIVATGSGPAEIAVPRDGTTSVLALTVEGGAKDGVVQPRGAQDDLALVLDAQDALVLRFSADDGAAIGSGHMRVLYGYCQVMTETIALNESVSVMNPADVEKITMNFPGYVPVELVPSALVEVPQRGSLDIHFHEAHTGRVRLCNARGDPLPGMRVDYSLYSATALSSAEGDPSRIRATAHPGWMQRSQPMLWGVTDYEGRARIPGLPEGVYVVSICQDSMRMASEDQPDLGESKLKEVLVPQAEECVVILDRRRQVSIEAYDGLTGAPVSSLDVSSEFSPYQTTLHIAGSFWQEWVPESWSSLRIGSPGFEPEVVELQKDLSPDRVKVALWPKDPQEIQVTGDVENLLGQTIRVSVLRRVLSPSGSFLSPIWSSEAVLGQDARLHSSISWLSAREGELVIRLEPQKSGGSSWGFFPKELAWSPGMPARFEARKQDP